MSNFNDPRVQFLTESIKQVRASIEWLVTVRLPEVQNYAANHIEYMLSTGVMNHAPTTVEGIKRIIEAIEKETQDLLLLSSLRDSLLTAEEEEDIFGNEIAEFKKNGTWIKKED